MNMKAKKSRTETSKISFSCSCKCKAQLQIQKAGDNLFLVDTREDGRRRWIGVTLTIKDVENLKDFLVKTI